jgi:Family of unknown function (DUF6600)/FecR protein
MRIRTILSKVVWGLSALLCAGALAWAQEYSHVRIVRLSFEEGTVNLTRPNVPGAEEASVNTPIQEGFSLSTLPDSFAEVEFENASTARIGQLSELGFNQLALDVNGSKLNGMELRQGYATFTIFPENGDVYQVQAAQVSVTPSTDKTVTFRVDVDGANVRVEVFKGAVDVGGSFGSQRLAKDDVLEFDPGEDEPLHVSHGITKDAWDEWVEQREQEAQLARRKSPPGYYTNQTNSYLYGWNDLYYYGNWSYVPGYGSCWIPAVGAGWIPYSYGQWTWYPGLGYTWVSFEPWGWLPFHYGGWIYQTGIGWAWVPDNFGAWSPALVSWYQGQTWVAWSPRPLRPRPGGGPLPTQSGCPGPACTTMQTSQAFRTGVPVQGHRPWLDVRGSDAVEKPTIAPAQAVFHGTGTTAAAGTEGVRTPAGSLTRPGGAPSGTAPRVGSGAAGDASQGGIVYDSTEGRFVNGRGVGPARPIITETSAPASSGTETRTPDAPRESSPAPATQEKPAWEGTSAPRAGPAAEGSHHVSPRTGVESSHPMSTFDKILNSWGVSNSSRGRSSSSGSSSSSSGGWSSSSSGGSSGSSSSSGSTRSAPSMSSSSGGGGGGGRAASPAPRAGGGRPHE